MKQQKKQPKQMLMCRYYGHGIPCPFLRRQGRCQQTHAEPVRNAKMYIQECKKNEQTPSLKEVERLLDPEACLSKIGVLVQRELLQKYPREPNDKDK